MPFFGIKKYSQLPIPPGPSFKRDQRPIPANPYDNAAINYGITPIQLPAFHDITASYPYGGYQDTSYDSGKPAASNSSAPMQWMEQAPDTAAPPPARGRTIGIASFWFRFWEGFQAAVSVCIILPFLVLAGVAAKLDGEPISDWGRKVTRASLLGPSFFPIFFAGVISNALAAIAGWLLEARKRGVTIGTLEALMGSKTISGTVITQLCLRKPNLISIGLLCLWALSPLGGQSSLRLLDTQDMLIELDLELNYQNTSAPFFSSLDGADDVGKSRAQVESVFTAALLSDGSSSQDPFGNVRIPFVNSNTSYVNTTSFVSYVGIPVQYIPGNNTTKFQIEAAYMTITVDKVSISQTYNASSSPNYCGGGEEGPSHIQFNQSLPADNGGGDASDGSHKMTMYIYSGAEDSGTAVFDIRVRNRKANYSIACINGTICSVTGSADTGEQPTIWADSSVGLISQNVLSTFECVDSLTPYDILTKAEQFILEGSPYAADPPSRFDTPNIYTALDQELLARRIAILFNTYYWASASLSPNLAFPFPDNTTEWTSHATVLAQHYEPRYRASRLWTGLLVICCLIAILLSIVGSILKVLTSEVEVLGFVSSLTRDNPYFAAPEVDCVDSGYKRSRRLLDRRGCVADIVDAGEAGVGHIAFCAIQEKKARVDRSRKLYAGIKIKRRKPRSMSL